MSDAAAKPIRSPSYPVMSLERAIQAVRKIEEKYRLSPVDRTDAAKLIGFGSLSGPANQALAALASYGLVERAGKGEMRVTTRAKALLYANNEVERHAALRAAALEPQLYRDLRERFSDMAVPPEEGVVTYLHRQNFSPSAIRPAAKAFLATLSYLEEAGANESHGSPSKHEGEPPSAEIKNPPSFGGAKAGDLVQWESSGALQFEKPLRVRAVSDDGAWVAVEGSETGIPMSEVMVEESGASRATPPSFPFDKGPNYSIAAVEGEAEWMRNKVGKATDVRLLVKGDMGPREIGRLIKLLEAQKAVLEDDDVFE